MLYTVEGYRATPTGKVHLFPVCTSVSRHYPDAELKPIGQVTVNGKDICGSCWKTRFKNARKENLRRAQRQ